MICSVDYRIRYSYGDGGRGLKDLSATTAFSALSEEIGLMREGWVSWIIGYLMLMHFAIQNQPWDYSSGGRVIRKISHYTFAMWKVCFVNATLKSTAIPNDDCGIVSWSNSTLPTSEFSGGSGHFHCGGYASPERSCEPGSDIGELQQIPDVDAALRMAIVAN